MSKIERLFLLDHLVSTLNTRLDELITINQSMFEQNVPFMESVYNRWINNHDPSFFL